jgi:N-acetylmuramoyl-L-alanine amidase
MMKIFLDIGHGGKDVGAVNGNLIEKEMNLTTALATAELLKKHGCDVKLSRTNDTYLTLTERAVMANKWGADYFVSIHYNAGGGDRGEVIHSVTGGKGQQLAAAIGDELKSLGQSTVRIYSKPSTKGGDYYTVIGLSNMPAVIVEGCFIDNVQDRKFADTAEKQKEICKSIAKGILTFLGIEIESEVEEMRYDWIKDMPDWAKPTVEKLYNRGIIKGDENGALNLTEDIMRMLVWHDRLGLYD